jgi:AbiTii
LLKHGTGTLQFPFDPGTEANLMKGMDIPLQTTRHLSRSSVSGIVEAVRNMVLEWCLELEKDGIMGDGMVFSGKEKEAASHSNYTINYNGPVSHSQIQQGSPQATQSMTVSDPESLGGHLITGHRWTLQNRPTKRNQNKSIYTLREAIGANSISKN